MKNYLKTLIIICLYISFFIQGFSQNTGVGTTSPTHSLHVKAVSGNSNRDPIRLEGLLEYRAMADSTILLVNPDSGLLRYLHIDSLMSKYGINVYNTDGQLSEDISMQMNGHSLLFAGTDSTSISPAGHLGIGTLAPHTLFSVVRTRLPFIPSLTDETTATFENDGNSVIAIFSNNSSYSVLAFGDQDMADPGNISYNHTLDQMEFQTNNTVQMVLDSSGYLGVGTLDPQAPLHITGSQNLDPESYILGGDNDNNFSAYADEYSTLASSVGGIDYSVIAEDKIAANEFNAYSDFRIKKDIEETQSEQDLRLIRQLKVQEYKYIDPIRNGTEHKKGFVAQEVAKVFSQAVGQRRGIIPNVFQTPVSAKWNAGVLQVKMNKSHGLKVGDKVKIMLPDEERLIHVSQVQDSLNFSAKTVQLDPDRLFIYGSEVSDFHTLDYDEIFTLNVSATQALADKVDYLTEKLEQQQLLVDQLIQENKKLKRKQRKKQKNRKK